MNNVIKRIWHFWKFLFTYDKLSRKLGMIDVERFCHIKPEVFTIPKGHQYSNNHFRGYLNALPGLQKTIEKFQKLSDDNITYVTILIRWFYHQENFKEVGIKTSWADPALIYPTKKSGLYSKKEEAFLISNILQAIRGPFDYDDEFSVVVCAIPNNDLEQYFEKFSNGYIRIKLTTGTSSNDVLIPPEYVVGVVSGPSKEESSSLDFVLRRYWHWLQGFGYKSTNTNYLGNMNNAFRSVIPEILTTDCHGYQKKIGFGHQWGARGILEAWHRLSKVVSIASQHKMEVKNS